MEQCRDATPIKYSAVFGHRKTLMREFTISEPKPYAQHKVSVRIGWRLPKKRKWEGTILMSDNIGFAIIEHEGKAVYDSRNDVPCDMNQFLQTFAERKAEWAAHCKEEEESLKRRPLPPGITINYGQHQDWSDPPIPIQATALRSLPTAAE
jgi:hypothetical protein